MTGEFDLLGDPIPENRGKRGRPPHVREMQQNQTLVSAGVDLHPHRPGAQDHRPDAEEVLFPPTPSARRGATAVPQKGRGVSDP